MTSTNRKCDSDLTLASFGMGLLAVAAMLPARPWALSSSGDLRTVQPSFAHEPGKVVVLAVRQDACRSTSMHKSLREHVLTLGRPRQSGHPHARKRPSPQSCGKVFPGPRTHFSYSSEGLTPKLQGRECWGTRNQFQNEHLHCLLGSPAPLSSCVSLRDRLSEESTAPQYQPSPFSLLPSCLKLLAGLEIGALAGLFEVVIGPGMPVCCGFMCPCKSSALVLPMLHNSLWSKTLSL